jgi:hypothetical protein
MLSEKGAGNMSALSFTSTRASTSWWGHVLWVLAAAILGFVITAVFAGQLHLERSLYLVVYAVSVSAFLYSYIRWSGIKVRNLIGYHWQWGLVVAVLAGAFVVVNVWSQPASPSPQGLELVFDLLWLGVVYGTVDALLLSVFPVLATWQALSMLGWTKHWYGKVVVGIVALVASLLVTAAYHLGYPEFQGPQVISPLIGNGILSLSYLLTMNPLSAVLSHIAMHMAAILHGINTTLQLPPHY